MTWSALLELIAEEVGAELAARIEERARLTMGGERITILKRRPLTAELVDTVAPGAPCEAAKKLGVHKATVYRVIRRRLIR